jgi:ADP-ribose diphosphatase
MTPPFTIILGDGLDEGCLSPQNRHLCARSSVGEREIERLFGRGREFGRGPLPKFLSLALDKAAAGGRVAVILLANMPANEPADEPAEPSPDGDHGFAPPLDELAARCRVIMSRPGQIPWSQLSAAVREASGIDPDTAVPGNTGLRFVVVGCHTEERILALAVFLRRVFPSDQVAVSSHLVGSATQAAHLAVLRHTLPGLGVEVLLDLADAARFADLDPTGLGDLAAAPCAIDPPEIRDELSADQRHIIELLCLHWTRATLRPLAGGFSGSLLFLADGFKGAARTEPMVLKVDEFAQMRRELSGYYQVKDLLGKHVPSFGYPVVASDLLGVGMELAAMEGHPQTLQDAFERAEDEASTQMFLRRLQKSVDLLIDKLYRNTRESGWVVPYRDFGLHAEYQQHWLRENTELILGYLGEKRAAETGIDLDQLLNIFKVITANDAGVDGEVCLVHGDLNYANVICDEGNNVWFIDWTHCGRMPLELDFAKLENDVKFVMTKSFDVDDLPRVRKFESYLLEERLPADFDALPEHLAFAKWDLRFRKILSAVRLIRSACFSLKETDDWVVYRIALLRYATHTLSFDEARGRGECKICQLAHALHSVDHLAFGLVSDLFHLRIHAERPDGYPERLRITIDEAPWQLDCPHYDPPYYVAQAVLDNQRPAGWADPEDHGAIRRELEERPARFRDAHGRPLNPRGRTGLAGRGLLGLWGSNLSVAALAVRPTGKANELEVLLGQPAGQTRLELPKSFLHPGESLADGATRVLETEADCRPDCAAEVLTQGYTYDSRQTDHAWVEVQAVLYFDSDGTLPEVAFPGGDFEEVKWWPLDATTVNRVPSSQASLLRDAIEWLRNAGRLDAAVAARLLERTG